MNKGPEVHLPTYHSKWIPAALKYLRWFRVECELSSGSSLPPSILSSVSLLKTSWEWFYKLFLGYFSSSWHGRVPTEDCWLLCIFYKSGIYTWGTLHLGFPCPSLWYLNYPEMDQSSSWPANSQGLLSPAFNAQFLFSRSDAEGFYYALCLRPTSPPPTDTESWQWISQLPL